MKTTINQNDKKSHSFGRNKTKPTDPYYNYYNMDYLYKVMVIEICKCLYKSASNLITLRDTCGTISFAYFKNPFKYPYWWKSNKQERQNWMSTIRFGFLEKMSYSRNGFEYMNELCWDLYDKNLGLDICISNAYLIALYSMWMYQYHNDLPDTMDRIKQCHDLVANWVSECIDEIICTVEYQTFECGPNYNPDNLPDLTRQNKVMEFIRWKIINPLLDIESCIPCIDTKNKIIPF